MKRDPLVFILILLMLIAFFLPWISFGGLITYRAYEMPLSAANVSNLLALTGKIRIPSEMLYFLYLLPIIWLLTLLSMLKNRTNIFMVWLSAALPFALFFAWFINHGASLFNALQIGGYITPATAMILLLCRLEIIKLKRFFSRR